MDQLTIEVSQPGELEPDALAVPFAEEDGASLSNGTRALDERLKGRLQRLVEDGELKGELGKTVLLHTDGELDARRLIVAGVGKRKDVDADTLRTAAAAVVRRLADCVQLYNEVVGRLQHVWRHGKNRCAE